MSPSMRPGQLVCATNAFMSLAPGDIVVVRHDGLEKIKRIQQIDGVKLFIVGDNQAESTDSRHFGWIDRSAVVGKVLWPKPRVTVRSVGVIR